MRSGNRIVSGVKHGSGGWRQRDAEVYGVPRYSDDPPVKLHKTPQLKLEGVLKRTRITCAFQLLNCAMLLGREFEGTEWMTRVHKGSKENSDREWVRMERRWRKIGISFEYTSNCNSHAAFRKIRFSSVKYMLDCVDELIGEARTDYLPDDFNKLAFTQEIVDLRNTGLLLQEIADYKNVNLSTVKRHLAKGAMERDNSMANRDVSEPLPSDLKVCNCAGCCVLLIGKGNPSHLVKRALNSGVKCVAGRIKDRPLCSTCLEHM